MSEYKGREHIAGILAEGGMKEQALIAAGEEHMADSRSMILLCREVRLLRAENTALAAKVKAMGRIVQEARYEMAHHQEHCDCDTCAAFFDLDFPGKPFTPSPKGAGEPCHHRVWLDGKAKPHCECEAAPSSPAWVELARLVAVAEDGRNEHTPALERLIHGCRRVIHMAQQEAAPGYATSSNYLAPKPAPEGESDPPTVYDRPCYCRAGKLAGPGHTHVSAPQQKR